MSLSSKAVNQNKTKTINPKLALENTATQLLPKLTEKFRDFGYLNICHQRLSQQKDNFLSYQGLTKAEHSSFGTVMIKWSLSPQSFSELSHEISVLKDLSKIEKTSKIVPKLLAVESSSFIFLDKAYRFEFLVMPYFASSLNKQIRQLTSLEQKQELLIKSAQIINNFHQSGWLHGDIKPSNILIDNSKHERQLLLTDFALSKQVSNSESSNVAGTPAYLAPECWHGQGLSLQSDIYAFGIMMVEILMGKRAFSIGKTNPNYAKAWATAHCQNPIPILPIDYQQYQPIINKALAKRQAQRYQSMSKIIKDLLAL
ncbi:MULTISPECIES: protein kinase [Psychrobacter]|uniref:protein kinase domain-containing protein n=1 Tax=Psychrobacter TaxID=497 RepID=UPI00146DA253|nr:MULTISPECIES: protein kinase [Psychrobacter]